MWLLAQEFLTFIDLALNCKYFFIQRNEEFDCLFYSISLTFFKTKSNNHLYLLVFLFVLWLWEQNFDFWDGGSIVFVLLEVSCILQNCFLGMHT